MSKITIDRLNPIWHRMLHSCTDMAAVGVKGLITSSRSGTSRGVGRKRR